MTRIGGDRRTKPLLEMLSRLTANTPLMPKIILKALYDQESRSVLRMLMRRDQKTHQTTTTTSLDRYPEAFSLVRDLLREKRGARILSYGCSTGEEVRTLRRYFPDAEIVGADINDECISVCNTLNLGPAIEFIRSDPAEILRRGPYDAIFAMAVLQRLPHLVLRYRFRNIRPLYPFKQFERQLLAFDSWTKEGGVIVIQNTQYRFDDTCLARDYEVVGNTTEDGNGPRHFDRDGQLASAPYVRTIFRKRGSI